MRIEGDMQLLLISYIGDEAHIIDHFKDYTEINVRVYVRGKYADKENDRQTDRSSIRQAVKQTESERESKRDMFYLRALQALLLRVAYFELVKSV